MTEDELHRSIEKLTGSEAKSLLLTFMYRLNNIRESQESQEMIEDLFSLYDEILNEPQGSKPWETNAKAAHIVCGESAAGTLRYALGGHENKVIGFPDGFAVGPIRELHTKAGQKHRYEWLKNHLNIEMDYLEEEYQYRYFRTLEEIEAIPEHMPIVVWTGENADEQTGMRYIFYLLREKPNDVFLINTTTAYQELFNTDEYQFFYFHTGEADPEKLKLIVQQKKTVPLSVEERNIYVNEWSTLSKSKGLLRIWKDNRIESVDENYYDQLIIDTARNRLQRKKDFLLAARLVGEVLGLVDNNVGDSFFEYRVRVLVYKGIFEIKGVPKSMRHYSIKLRE